MTQNNLVSVIIPAYNRTQELKRAITSVLNQSFQNLEIVVVDDGSEKNIKSVCDDFNDARIRFLRNEKHTNANVARNRGIKEAKGKYIAMLDSDDEYLPNHLERRIEKIEEWNCDGIFGSAYIFDGETKKLNLSRPLKPDEKMIDYLLGTGSATTPTHFYKRSAAFTTLWDESLQRHQDYDFSIRFSEQFNFRSDFEPTVIIHWMKGEKRNTDFISNIAFIEKYKDSASPFIIGNYFVQMYKMANHENDVTAKKYYLNEIKKTIQFISLSQWFDLKETKKSFQKASSILKYLFYTIFRLLKSNKQS